MLFDVADALSIPPSVIQEQLTEIQWADHINAGAIAQILGQGLEFCRVPHEPVSCAALSGVSAFRTGEFHSEGWKIHFPTAEPPGQLG